MRRGSGQDSAGAEAGGFMKILVFPKEFQGFLVSEAVHVKVYVGPRLVKPQDGFWTNFGRLLGGQDAPKTAQDGAKTGQYGAKTPQDGARMS